MLTRFVRIQLLIFTIIGIVGVIAMVLFYIQAPTLLGIGRMTVTLELPSTGGLYRFSNVTYRGVQVGKVTAVALAANGAKVVLEVQPELTALMARLEGAATVIARGAAPPQQFDVHCPLGSLPLAFKTEPATVPADIPYLSADDAHLAKWSAPIGALERPRIALAWSGNPSHLNDRNRSIAFAKLAALLSIPAQFVSIQRDVRGDDAIALAGENRVTNVGAELENFADTAAVITATSAQ